MEKELLEFNDYLEIEKKLDIRYGVITNVEEIPKSSKLIKLNVDFGTEQRVVVTNIKNQVKDWTELKNQGSFFVMNLKPVTMMGVESQAMILPINNDGKLSFFYGAYVEQRGSKLM